MRKDVALAARLYGALRRLSLGARLESLMASARRLGSGMLLIRKALVVALGVGLGDLMVERWLYPALVHSLAFARLYVSDTWGAEYFLASSRWGWRCGIPLVLLGLVNFVEVHAGVEPGRRRRSGSLPPFPRDPKKTQLVLGEIHHQDGSRSDEPEWLILPEAGMYTGLLVVGATGRGKTSSALYPFLSQMIALHAADPKARFAGVFMDTKGNASDDVRKMCRAAGREEDFYEVRIPNVRMNILNRPDLSSAALASHISDVIANVEGTSKDNAFWEMAARELATQALRVIRLAQDRPPTMDQLYRTSSLKGYERRLQEAMARAAKLGAQGAGELESLQLWFEDKFKGMDEKTRANIDAHLSGISFLFDEPQMRRYFCATPAEETFPGFDALIEQGKIVVLSFPKAELKKVGVTVATMAKLNYQDAVLSRLARATAANAPVGRGAFFVADEYDEFVTPADGAFLSKCREARAVNILAIQGYPSLGAKMRDREVVEQLLGQLTTKVWFGVEDNETAEAAAKLCGKVDREKVSRTTGESSQRSAFSFLDRQSITEGTASASATTTRDVREEYLFPPRVFTSLERWQAVMKVFDGVRALPPWVVYTKPMHLDPNESWFAQAANDEEEE